MDSPDKSNRVIVLPQGRTGKVGGSAIEREITRRSFLGKLALGAAALATGAIGAVGLFGAAKIGEEKANSAPAEPDHPGYEPPQKKPVPKLSPRPYP